jgi:hypothetical protein
VKTFVHTGTGAIAFDDPPVVIPQKPIHNRVLLTPSTRYNEREMAREIIRKIAKAKSYLPCLAWNAKADQCRYIEGNDHVCCGKKVRDGKSYCDEHLKICTDGRGRYR